MTYLYTVYIYIYGLPIKNGDFPWQTVSHNQIVFQNWKINEHGDLTDK